jgi:hypothetical protein
VKAEDEQKRPSVEPLGHWGWTQMGGRRSVNLEKVEEHDGESNHTIHQGDAVQLVQELVL